MSAHSKLLKDLKAGKLVGTDNMTASFYGTNKIPDLVYKIRKQGHKIKTSTVKIKQNGVLKRVARYSM